LDLSAAALDTARERLGDKGADVNWVVADVTTWEPSQTYDLWHDRAAFHFLTDASDRSAYIGHLKKAVRPGGHVVIGTFAPAGPERCSGLPVMRYDANTFGAILGAEFNLLDSRRHVIKITRLIRAIDQEAAVWVERADRFPGSTAGACLILKKLGVDAVLAQPFPNFLIFSTDDLRYEEIVLRKKTSDLSRAQRTAAFKSQSRWANSGTFF
jgi:SAM-dependent methyltransferase